MRLQKYGQLVLNSQKCNCRDHNWRLCTKRIKQLTWDLWNSRLWSPQQRVDVRSGKCGKIAGWQTLFRISLFPSRSRKESRRAWCPFRYEIVSSIVPRHCYSRCWKFACFKRSANSTSVTKYWFRGAAAIAIRCKMLATTNFFQCLTLFS